MADGDLDVLTALPPRADHRDVELVLRAAGWTSCGAGDWAIVLRAPTSPWAARISPFDPAARYTAELYRRGAATDLFPRLHLHRQLAGGGALTVLELLEAVDPEEAAALHRRLEGRDETLAAGADLIDQVHALARSEQEWWGPTDDNPSNVMRTAQGRLVITDPYYADGPALYRAVLEEPERVREAFAPDERRYILDLPLTETGPWDPEVRERMRAALHRADAAQDHA